MRVHAGIGLAVLFAGRWLGFDTLRMAVLFLTVGAVIGAEWINTALERAVDLVTTEKHPLARQAKDLSASAVLWFSIVAVAVGLLLFVPHLGALPGAVLDGPPGRRPEVIAVALAAGALIVSGLRR